MISHSAFGSPEGRSGTNILPQDWMERFASAAALSLHFPIPTHSYKWFIQSTFKAGRRSVIRAVPLCALIVLRRNID